MKLDDSNNLKLLNIFESILDMILSEYEQKEQNQEDYINDVKTKVKNAFEKSEMEFPEVPDKILLLRKMLGGESDRGCALAAAAFLDEELCRLLKKIVLQDTDLHKTLFVGTGPLATFSSRIELLYGLGYLAPLQKRDLHLIRKIRNEFAHQTGDLNFNHPSISSRCNELKYDYLQEIDLTPRQKFIRVVLGIAAPIHYQINKATTPEEAEDIDLNSDSFKEKSNQLKKHLDSIK